MASIERATATDIRLPYDQLHAFAGACLRAAGAREEDAVIVADVLLAADVRGIESHGIARLRRYVVGLQSGAINAAAKPKVIAETKVGARLDADNGLGQPVSLHAMQLSIQKAQECGIGIVGVCHTNHFGIAGYYAALAVERGMAGFATTNASPQVAPTHAAVAMYGTNPIAIALPTGGATPFLLDMATSAVPRGRLERMQWNSSPMPEGWAIEPGGRAASNIDRLLGGLRKEEGFALLPLGGFGEVWGGHKGYGLGLLVDLLCGPLAGAGWGRHVYGPNGANLGHWFAAIKIDDFIPIAQFQESACRMFDEIRSVPKIKGETRVYIPGEKEEEERRCRLEKGIRLATKVYTDLVKLGKDTGVKL